MRILVFAVAIGLIVVGCGNEDDAAKQARLDEIAALKKSAVQKDKRIARLANEAQLLRLKLKEIEAKRRHVNVVVPKNVGAPSSPPSMVVSISADGSIFAASRRVSHVDLDRVFEALAKKNKQAQVFIEADKKTPYKVIVGVMERATRAGLSRLMIKASGK